MKECIDERSRMDPCRRMHDHAAPLVDDNNIGILIEYIERDILCTYLRLLCGGSVQTTISPPLSLKFALRRSPSTATFPPAISRWA